MRDFVVYGAGYGGSLVRQGSRRAVSPEAAVLMLWSHPEPGETFAVFAEQDGGSTDAAWVFRTSKKGNLKSVVKDPSTRGPS